MNLFARMTRAVKSFFAAATWESPLVKWLYGTSDDGGSDAGVEVNAKAVLSYAPFWYLISKISGHVAQLPCNAFQWLDDRESKVAKHPAQKLVKYRANAYMAADVFRETMQAHALLWGNGRSVIVRNNRNDPTELIILHPERTQTVLVNGEKWHVVTIQETGEKFKFPDADVLHIMGLSPNGIQGHSLIEMARDSIGLGLASEKSASKHFKNNAVPGMILEAPKGTFRDEKDAQAFMENFNKLHTGLNNSSKAALMREGMKATALSMSSRDSQWIEQRKFQRQEAALWLVCEQILGDDSSVSYNSLEQKNLAYLTNCLNRWLVRWENELREKLLTGKQKRDESHYFKFNRNALLAMSANDRADFYTKMVGILAMNPNEVREKEDLPPYEGGDEFQNPHINPKQQAETGAEPTDNPPPTKQPPADDQAATNRIRQLITARLTPLVNAERRVVEKSATTEKNFCSWLEGYYGGDAFLPQLSRAVIECGGSPADADAYCLESKSLLLTVAGNATKDTLGEAVKEELAKWTSRVAELAEQLSKPNEKGKVAA